MLIISPVQICFCFYIRIDCILFPCPAFIQQAVFFNFVSGLALAETAGDLAIAAAICSWFLFRFFFLNDVNFVNLYLTMIIVF